jgi:hypothetical protein
VDGTRKVTSIREVTGTVEGGQVVSNELWRPGPVGAAHPAAPPSEKLGERLDAQGFAVVEQAMADGWWRS